MEQKGGKMFSQISKELKIHAPFTIFGAITGAIIIALFQKLPSDISYSMFYILHPIHVVLSALVTASMYRLHTCDRISGKCIRGKCNLWFLLIIGYIGSVGIATISDSIIPYLGEVMLKMPNREIHFGFIEKWWLVNPLAIIGVLVACFKPTTKFPHMGHVLLSTWASLFHIIMSIGGKQLNWFVYAAIFLFLFLAVWIPCCVSDIVFPLLFVKGDDRND
jgi:branched-subunit amino acid transport protein